MISVEGRIRNVNWLCPFNEANKRQYKDELRLLAGIPALRFVYLNDEGFLGAYGEMACYCESCRGRFVEYFGEEPPTRIDWKDPLWRNWIKWRFEQWTAVHADFREAVRDVRPELGVGMATACTELMGDPAVGIRRGSGGDEPGPGFDEHGNLPWLHARHASLRAPVYDRPGHGLDLHRGASGKAVATRGTGILPRHVAGDDAQGRPVDRYPALCGGRGVCESVVLRDVEGFAGAV